jgi:signal transduction histidine kinase
MVTVDRHALLRALTNLVDNARALGTRVAIVADAGPPVTIDICDDGPGIAPEVADSLFRPFVSRRPGGTGLGLAIVRRIMEAHGGTVTLAERPGWSTCFRLTFEASR